MSNANSLTDKRLRSEFLERVDKIKNTVKCPTCEQPHALWYRVSAGNKKSLMYTCNRQKQFWYTNPLTPGGKPVEHWRYVTKSFESPVFIDGLPVFTDWSPSKKAEYHKKNQHQLPLMVKK